MWGILFGLIGVGALVVQALNGEKFVLSAVCFAIALVFGTAAIIYGAM